MTFLRKEKRIEKGTLGAGESYEVEVVVHVYWNPETQQEEDCYDSVAMEKIEAAIEQVHPGWFHTCFQDHSTPCQACQRQKRI